MVFPALWTARRDRTRERRKEKLTQLAGRLAKEQNVSLVCFARLFRPHIGGGIWRRQAAGWDGKRALCYFISTDKDFNWSVYFPSSSRQADLLR